MESVATSVESVVYAVCAIAALACAVLLLRSYWQTGFRLLLWTGICFILLTVNNILLFIDLVVAPSIDFSWPRQLSTLLGGIVLLYGLIWETK
jgi:hypothetical protein